MEPSATSTTVTGPVGERLQAGNEDRDAPVLDCPPPLRRLHDSGTRIMKTSQCNNIQLNSVQLLIRDVCKLQNVNQPAIMSAVLRRSKCPQEHVNSMLRMLSVHFLDFGLSQVSVWRQNHEDVSMALGGREEVRL